jgi:hypothetical protein
VLRLNLAKCKGGMTSIALKQLNFGKGVLARNPEQKRNISLSFGTIGWCVRQLARREPRVHGPAAWFGLRQPGKVLVMARILSMSAIVKTRPLPSLGSSGYLPVLKRQRMVSGWMPRRGQRSAVR